MSMKNPMTPAAIEPATFRFVAQHLNHCATAVPFRHKKIKVKQSHYRPAQAQMVRGGTGSQISRQSAHEGGKVVSPMHRPHLPPRKYPWYSFPLEGESTPGP